MLEGVRVTGGGNPRVSGLGYCPRFSVRRLPLTVGCWGCRRSSPRSEGSLVPALPGRRRPVGAGARGECMRRKVQGIAVAQDATRGNDLAAVATSREWSGRTLTSGKCVLFL